MVNELPYFFRLNPTLLLSQWNAYAVDGLVGVVLGDGGRNENKEVVVDVPHSRTREHPSDSAGRGCSKAAGDGRARGRRNLPEQHRLPGVSIHRTRGAASVGGGRRRPCSPDGVNCPSPGGQLHPARCTGGVAREGSGGGAPNFQLAVREGSARRRRVRGAAEGAGPRRGRGGGPTGRRKEAGAAAQRAGLVDARGLGRRRGLVEVGRWGTPGVFSFFSFLTLCYSSSGITPSKSVILLTPSLILLTVRHYPSPQSKLPQPD